MSEACHSLHLTPSLTLLYSFFSPVSLFSFISHSYCEKLMIEHMCLWDSTHRLQGTIYPLSISNSSSILEERTYTNSTIYRSHAYGLSIEASTWEIFNVFLHYYLVLQELRHRMRLLPSKDYIVSPMQQSDTSQSRHKQQQGIQGATDS